VRAFPEPRARLQQFSLLASASPRSLMALLSQDVARRANRRLPFLKGPPKLAIIGGSRLMRRLIVLVIASSALSCSPNRVVEQAFVPPAPSPPPLRAPVCAHPAEAVAINGSALVSQLQVITVTCHTEDKYNALIVHLRPALATNERNLKSFFARAYGRRAQTERDSYITTLANLQSQLGLKSGDQFCRLNSGIFDEVMPLSTPEALSTYAVRKPVQQALAVTECSAASASNAKSRGK
jgi:hypothetical protein